MTTRTRINTILADWCGVAPVDQTLNLEILWASTVNDTGRPHKDMAFQPDGVSDLLSKLDDEFTKPNETLKDTSRLNVESFTPTGNIVSVDDLVSAIRAASMPIRQRVNMVLYDWCGEKPNDIDQAMGLDLLWTATRNKPARPHNGLDFQPDAAVDLLSKLASEFGKPGSVRKRISVLTPNSFKPTGNIDSVNNLVEGVVGCPNLPPEPEGD